MRKEVWKNIIDGEFEKISESKREELLAKSFISESGEYEERINLVASKYVSLINGSIIPPSLFLIVPTLRCDHDCGYCQVSRVPVSRNNYDLDVDKIEKIISIIKKSTQFKH